MDQTAVDCATQHIRTFLAQATNKEKADLGKACSYCPLRKKGQCTKYDWLEKMNPILSQSTIKLSVNRAGQTNYE